MKKLVSVLFTLLLSSSLIGCNSKESKGYKATSNWSYYEADEEMINVTKEGVEIASINMINIPSKGIPIAGWDSSNIKMEVMYSDLSTDTFAFKEKHIPLVYRHFLGEIGHHTMSLAINGVDLNFAFDIIGNPNFHGYTCTFRNTRMQDEPIVYQTTVGYYQTVEYAGPGFADVVIDDDFVERFSGWDYPLYSVHQDMEFRNVFKKVEKRYYSRGLGLGANYYITATHADENQKDVLLYLGRMQSVAINHGYTVHHKKGVLDDELAFGQFNPYNEMWNEMNSSIHKYGFEYTVNSKYNSYLYGTNGAFSNSTTFLANFESKFGDIGSYSLTLEDLELINTSNQPNYSSTYNVARSYLTYTKQIDVDADDGYYRIAVTMPYDIYVSVSFTKLAEGKYQLLQGSKFNFAPVLTDKRVVLQYSETEEFDNPFDKKINLSNELLYQVADSLSW